MQRQYTYRVLEMKAAMLCRHRDQHGFTLIELMVTVSVMVILMMVAAPNFVTFQRNSELRSAANSFLASMSAARVEAMQRGMRVYIVPKSSNDWRTGWKVFVDTNWNGEFNDGVDVVVSEEDPLPSAITVPKTNVSAFERSSSTSYVAFGGSGFPTLSAGATGAPSGAIEFVTGTENRRVVLTANGRMRVCKSTDAECPGS